MLEGGWSQGYAAVVLRDNFLELQRSPNLEHLLSVGSKSIRHSLRKQIVVGLTDDFLLSQIFMIILNENLPREAFGIAKVIKEVYGLGSEIIDGDFKDDFEPIPKFGGYRTSWLGISLKPFQGKAVLALTQRDLYVSDESQDDDWIFGYSGGNLSVVSTARLRGDTSKPTQAIRVLSELYLRRLNVMAVHEIGHSVVKGKHFQDATWVSIQNNRRLPLGLHCTDNTCAMYEVVDLKAPHPGEGYMQLGREKKFDAGLDDLIERMNPQYLCGECRNSIKLVNY